MEVGPTDLGPGIAAFNEFPTIAVARRSISKLLGKHIADAAPSSLPATAMGTPVCFPG